MAQAQRRGERGKQADTEDCWLGTHTLSNKAAVRLQAGAW